MGATCVQVQPPVAAVQPPTAVIQAATAIGPCDAVRATADASYGSLGRPLALQWSLLDMQGPGLLPIERESLRQYLTESSGRQARISIPVGLTASATNVTLRVEVLNFLSPTLSHRDVTIVRVQQAVPRVSIIGGSLIEVSALRPMVLQTRVIASPCIDASVQQDSIRWEMLKTRPTNGVSVSALANRILPESVLAGYRLQLGRVLSMPAGVLRAGQTVTLRATVSQLLLTGGTQTTV